MIRSITVGSLAVLMVAAPLYAGQLPASDLGAMTNVSGEVHLIRGEQEALKPTMEGGRVKDGALKSGDTLVCVKDAAATIELTDGSELALSNGAHIVIAESRLAPGEGREKATSRRLITVKAGDLAWRIAPDKEKMTDFELPTGFVRVTGTAGKFSVSRVVGRDVAVKSVDEGEVFFIEMIGKDVYAQGTLGKGQSLEEAREGSVMFLTAVKAVPPIVVTLANDALLVLDSGESVAITILDDGRIRVEALKGAIEIQEPDKPSITIPEGTWIELGAVAAAATPRRSPQPWFPPSWEPERRRTTEEGEAEEEGLSRSVSRSVASPSAPSASRSSAERTSR